MEMPGAQQDSWLYRTAMEGRTLENQLYIFSQSLKAYLGKKW